MRFFACFFHELRTLCISSATYWAASLFLGLVGVLYLFILQGYSLGGREDSPMLAFFSIFWLPVFFLVPLLTMRSLADERRQGTLESLMTTPISGLAVVFAKFLAAYCIYFLLWFFALSFPFLASFALGATAMGIPLVERTSLLGGFSFVALSGLLYISIGIFASSMTRSQLVSGMLSFTLIFVCMLAGRFMGEFSGAAFGGADQVWQGFQGAVEYLQTFSFLQEFSTGIIDSRPLFLYVSSTFVLLCITGWVVESKA